MVITSAAKRVSWITRDSVPVPANNYLRQCIIRYFSVNKLTEMFPVFLALKNECEKTKKLASFLLDDWIIQIFSNCFPSSP